MLWFNIASNGAVQVKPHDKMTDQEMDTHQSGWKNRNDFHSFAQAERIAIQASASDGEIYIATDGGPGMSPRYDVIKLPSIGDPVSRGFNGDYYPTRRARLPGSATDRSTGGLRPIPAWCSGGGAPRVAGSARAPGAWWRGHHDERNPEF